MYVFVNVLLDKRDVRNRRGGGEDSPGTGTGIAAGAMLAMISDTMISDTMISDTMIPDAFRSAHSYTALVATLGFLTSLIIHQIA